MLSESPNSIPICQLTERAYFFSYIGWEKTMWSCHKMFYMPRVYVGGEMGIIHQLILQGKNNVYSKPNKNDIRKESTFPCHSNRYM